MNVTREIQAICLPVENRQPVMIGASSISLGVVRRSYALAPAWDECCMMAVLACGLLLLYGGATGEIPLAVVTLGALSVAYPLVRMLGFPMRLLFADAGCVLVYPFGRFRMIPYRAISGTSGGVIEVNGRALWLWWSPSISLDEHRPEIGQLLSRLVSKVDMRHGVFPPRSITLWCISLLLWTACTIFLLV